ncbi:MAG TPA: mandelate racemase/muconate lactonizing enzyme family protein [Stellaceae bacterium]|nr:mandelate racemase/muconate lactonizing enzyme family protein [Stellaceae bacterium]
MAPVKIARIEAIPLSIPYERAGNPSGWARQGFAALTTLLVRVETEDGLVGWGDAFAYNCQRAVQAAVEDMVTPAVLGRDARDIAGIMLDLQKLLHLFGRYGITIFALSGLDIALWDLAGKRAGKPLVELLGGPARMELDAYASLFRLHDREIVAEQTREAIARGYRYIKLHETQEPEVKASREAAGPGIPIMVDTNCPWTPAEARENALKLKKYDLHWLEEPIFPPENFRALAALRAETGIPIAAGENACTSFEFEKMLAAGAVTYAQPSVTKVGGITEFRKVAALVEAAGVSLMPHSPYFGPGFLATLHLAAAQPAPSLIERFYLKVEASLYGDAVDPVRGKFRLPSGPGLGCEPDAEVIKTYRVKES